MHAERKSHEPWSRGGSRAGAIPHWISARRASTRPPAIEEWLRDSRARLLRRYGGVIGASTPGTRFGR